MGGAVVDPSAAIVRRLLDPGNARSPRRTDAFPATIPDEPGLYSWWVDAQGLRQLSGPFNLPLSHLIYAGQAGAASARTATPSCATLRSRIGGNHLNGNIRSSTFRHTLAAVLREPLGLRVATGRGLDGESNRVLTGWIREHLSVAWATCAERSTLAALEHAVLRQLDPPLNLAGMPSTPVRLRLRELRRELDRASRGGAFDAHVGGSSG